MGLPRANVLIARRIAERAGYQPNSHFRTILAGLCRRGYLESTRKGYRKLRD